MVGQVATRVTIDMLPDDVLLDIFDLFLDLPPNLFVDRSKMWQMLVHVCRRWRGVVFQSPRRLDLQILCTARRPVREMLDIWPALPLTIWVGDGPPAWGMENVIAALEHRDRISRISIDHTSSLILETLLPVMQEPFPALKFLDLDARVSIPNSFLGGSAPDLRHLYLEAVPFPTLPTLLLSATSLVTLSLRNLPHSGYISPESMAACLLPLTKLERLVLKFQSTLSRPDPERRNSPSPRATLPALTRFEFKGVSDYFEDLVAQIDATPVLDCLQITFFKQPIFHTPHLSQFVCRVPKFHALIGARVIISSSDVSVTVTSPTRTLGPTLLSVGVALRDLDWQPLSLAWLCTSTLPVVLTAEHLYLTTTWAHWWQDTENTQWLELLLPFTSVKNLYLSKEFASHIAPALQELVGERVTEVLPALQNLFLAELQPSGLVQQAIGQFVSARQLVGRPIAVSQWV